MHTLQPTNKPKAIFTIIIQFVTAETQMQAGDMYCYAMKAPESALPWDNL